MTVFRMAVEQTLNGMPDKAVNIWHFRAGTAISQAGSPVDEAAFTGAVNAIHGFYQAISNQGTHPMTLLANGVTSIATAAINVETKDAHNVSWAPITVGDAGPKMPFSASLVLNWYSSQATRRGRGRTFLGPLHSGILNADGTPSDPVLVNLRTIAQDLVGASGQANGWAIGVWGLESPGGNAQSPHVLRDIVGYKVNDRFGWLRSRNK